MRTSATVAIVVFLLASAFPITTATHDTGCSGAPTTDCTGSWDVPSKVNPAWWNTDPHLYTHAPKNNQPAWIKVTSDSTSLDPYEVTLEVTGTVVASLDIFEVQLDFDEEEETNDVITPKCPQGFAEWFFPRNEEGIGSPSHVLRIRRLALEHHIMVVPDPLTLMGSTTVELARDQDWVLVFDARAGTSDLDATTMQTSTVSYEISVASDNFDPDALASPDLPLDQTVWETNAVPCLTYVPDPWSS